MIGSRISTAVNLHTGYSHCTKMLPEPKAIFCLIVLLQRASYPRGDDRPPWFRVSDPVLDRKPVPLCVCETRVGGCRGTFTYFSVERPRTTTCSSMLCPTTLRFDHLAGPSDTAHMVGYSCQALRSIHLNAMLFPDHRPATQLLVNMPGITYTEITDISRAERPQNQPPGSQASRFRSAAAPLKSLSHST